MGIGTASSGRRTCNANIQTGWNPVISTILLKVYDEQNMKDKMKAYTDKGYKFKLILDKKEIKL